MKHPTRSSRWLAALVRAAKAFGRPMNLEVGRVRPGEPARSISQLLFAQLSETLRPTAAAGSGSMRTGRKPWQLPMDGKVAVGLAALAVLTLASVTFIAAQSAASGDAEDWASWSIAHPLEANVERRQDPAVVEAQEFSAFSILNPDVANEERRSDPAVVEAERLAAYAILHARELEAERRKDPELRRVEEEAWQALVGGGNPLKASRALFTRSLAFVWFVPFVVPTPRKFPTRHRQRCRTFTTRSLSGSSRV